MVKQKSIDIFYSNIRQMPNGCQEWTKYCDGDGYGRIGATALYRHYKKSGAYQIAWTLQNGPIPDGLMIRHQCQNRRCCNPAHMLLGTAQDNANDAKRDGTTLKGSNNGFSKLKEQDALNIREAYDEGKTAEFLSRKHNVSKVCIYSILKRETWTHV